MSNQIDAALTWQKEQQRLNRSGKDYLRSLLPFHAPCPQLCRKIVDAKGFHLTCLTCPTRKFTFKKYGWRNLSERKTLIMVMESASGKPFIMPKQYDSYGLIIPRNISRIRRQIVKTLMTVAERVAEA